MAHTTDVAAARPILKRARDAMKWPAAPRWMAWTPQAAVLWALAYGAVRVWWAVNGDPSLLADLEQHVGLRSPAGRRDLDGILAGG